MSVLGSDTRLWTKWLWLEDTANISGVRPLKSFAFTSMSARFKSIWKVTGIERETARWRADFPSDTFNTELTFRSGRARRAPRIGVLVSHLQGDVRFVNGLDFTSTDLITI